MNAIIRPAIADDAAAASCVALAAKAFWGYAPEVLDKWRPLLRFTADYIARHMVFVADLDGAVVGVCSLEEHGKHRELAHLWVHPSAQGRGLGKAMLHRVRTAVAGRRGPLRLASDPNAAAFYLRLGGRRVGAISAAIPTEPNRTLPVFEFDCSPPM